MGILGHHHKDNIPESGRELHLGIPLTGLGGIRSIWPLQPSQKQFIFMAKELFIIGIFGWVDSHVWGISIDREKSGAKH